MRTTESKTLFLLSFLQMWKFFSHFGVRSLLVLYMVDHLAYFDEKAFTVNAVFCGLVELGGIFGGIIADRYLGLRKAMLVGSVLLGVGYIGLVFEEGLFLSMGIIIMGSSLFSGNIMALLGLACGSDDQKRTKGFTNFYMMQNLGALASIGVCGLAATYYGFRLGFVVAASGMLIGNIVLFFNRRLLKNLGEIPQENKKPVFATVLSLLVFILGSFAVSLEKIVFLFLPWITVGILVFFGLKLLKDPRITKKQIAKLFIYLGSLILFFAVEDQICSSLLLFGERQVDRVLLGWSVPSSFIAILNPIVIIVFGGLVARKKMPLITPFILTGGAFCLLAMFCLADFHFPVLGLMGIVAIISVAELMIGPLVLSCASQVSAKENSGLIMGMVPIAFSLAFQLSGAFSKMFISEEVHFSLKNYSFGFGLVALVLILGGIVLQILIRRLSYKELITS